MGPVSCSAVWGGGRSGRLSESDPVDSLRRNENVFGLSVSEGLPGEHAEIVLLESVVVESFSGVMVVDAPADRWCRLVHV